MLAIKAKGKRRKIPEIKWKKLLALNQVESESLSNELVLGKKEIKHIVSVLTFYAFKNMSASTHTCVRVCVCARDGTHLHAHTPSSCLTGCTDGDAG